MQAILMFLGVACCATAVIWIKKCDIDPVLLSSLRLVIAAAAVSPLFVRDWLRRRDEVTAQHLRDAAIPGVVLALHFITWILAVRMTSAVNSTLLVNLTPIVMPLMLYWFNRELPARTELIGTVVAGLGLAILFISDYALSREHFLGDLICIGSMLILAVYLTLGRRHRHHPTVWLYVAPMYASAALTAALLTPLLARDLTVDWAKEWPWVLALGLITTVMGHSLLNNAMRHFRGQIVSLANMTQFVIAGVMAYLMLPNETPSWAFYPASLLMVSAGVIVLWRPRMRGANAIEVRPEGAPHPQPAPAGAGNGPR